MSDLIEILRARAKQYGGDWLLYEAADALEAAREDLARVEHLAGALRNVLPFVVSDVLEHCDGNKCRERWCAGCSGDDKAADAVARSTEAVAAARALLHSTSTQ